MPHKPGQERGKSCSHGSPICFMGASMARRTKVKANTIGELLAGDSVMDVLEEVDRHKAEIAKIIVIAQNHDGKTALIRNTQCDADTNLMLDVAKMKLLLFEDEGG